MVCGEIQNTRSAVYLRQPIYHTFLLFLINAVFKVASSGKLGTTNYPSPQSALVFVKSDTFDRKEMIMTYNLKK